MKSTIRWTITSLVALLLTIFAPAVARADTPYCGIRWGSLDKSGVSNTPFVGVVSGVRAGQHRCYDRLVIDLSQGASYSVRYVDAVPHQAIEGPIALRGGAFLEIVLQGVSYEDPRAGECWLCATGPGVLVPAYVPANANEVVDVTGWRTFRQVASDGPFEGFQTVGLGVRARLPFRVFALAGPNTYSRVVIDVAHRW
jgi:hypothetical protein